METTIRERPILFSGLMVRAILDGRKWMTRRVVGGPNADILDQSEYLCWQDGFPEGGLTVFGVEIRCSFVEGEKGVKASATIPWDTIRDSHNQFLPACVRTNVAEFLDGARIALKENENGAG